VQVRPVQGVYGPGFYFGPGGFSIGPIYVPNPNYYAPPVYTPPPVYAAPPVYAVPSSPSNCVTAAYDAHVNVRVAPDGPAITVMPNGVSVTAYSTITDAYGYPWTRIQVGAVTGWVRTTSINCY
jgi:hypothetical protein